MIMFCAIMVVISMFILVGCIDRAKDGYDNCIQLERTNIEAAWNVCRMAADADPGSKFGVAAKAKAAQLEPAARKSLADRIAKETATQQAARERALQSLRMKIHRTTTFSTEDDHCAGEGKPGHSYRYGGGTYDENESLAGADGCVPYNKDSMVVVGNAQNHFCCP